VAVVLALVQTKKKNKYTQTKQYKKHSTNNTKHSKLVYLMAVIWNTQRMITSAINTFVLLIVRQYGTRKEQRFMQGSAPSHIAHAVHACLDSMCLIGGLGVEAQQICLRKVPVIVHVISFCKK
jgi:hypothetical protein